MSHPFRPSLLTWALLAGLACSNALAQYRWTDAQGQVHASDLPPPRNIPDKNILQQPTQGARLGAASAAPASTAALRSAASAAQPAAAAALAGRAASAGLDPELEARRKRADAEALARKRAEADSQAAQRAENCRRASDHLARLSNNQRLVRTNAQGERETVSEAQRSDEIALARRVIDSDCR